MVNARSINPSDASYISNVLQYLSENLSEPLLLESTAEYFGVSRTKMNKDLYSVTGMTFKNYLTELRMIKAKGLMEDGHSVTEAAQECGYNSESNFTIKTRTLAVFMKSNTATRS